MQSKQTPGVPAERRLGSDYLASLANLVMPLAFVHGAKNRTFLPQGIEDTLVLLREIHPGSNPKSLEFADFGHMDCYLSDIPSAASAFRAISDLLDGF